MNKTLFSQWVSNPKKESNIPTSTVEKLVAEYPFFTAGQLLLLQQYNAQEHIHAQKQFKRLAIQFPDRSVLKQYFTTHHELDTWIDQNITATDTLETLQAADLTPEMDVPTIADSDMSFEKETDLTAAVMPDLYVSSETEAEAIAITSNDESMLLTFDSTATETEDHATIHANEEAQSNEEKLQSTSRTFLNWLSQIKNDKPRIDQNERFEKVDELNEIILQSQPVYSLTDANTTEKETTLLDYVTQLNQRQKENTTVEPVHNTNLVSETLAKIFEGQGMISDAIQVYQQLSLLFPEKMVYFASQITRLREQPKN